MLDDHAVYTMVVEAHVCNKMLISTLLRGHWIFGSVYIYLVGFSMYESSETEVDRG
jgi:hypothetical protein